MTARDLLVGVDIGGTKIEAVVVTVDGTIAARHRRPTGHGPTEVAASAIAAIEAVLADAEAGVDRVTTVGVGIPGAVDTIAGTVSHALNLGVDHLELGPLLIAHFGVPVRVENDVNAAALGAFHTLGLPTTASIGYLNLGTGLAAGLVLRGELWRGSRGAAGEIGHILVDPAGPLDLDGQRGGLEVMASGSGLARQWGVPSGNAVLDVLAAAEAGDERALEIRRRLFEGVAASVRILVLTVDVDTVVIGGGLSGLGQRLLDGVHAVFDDWSSSSPFIASLTLRDRIVLAPEGAPVAALGAAHLGGTRG